MCTILKSWEQTYGVFMKGWLSKLAIDQPLLRYFVLLTVILHLSSFALKKEKQAAFGSCFYLHDVNNFWSLK